MAGSPTFVRKVGDTGKGLQVQLRHEPSFDQRVGDVVDLSQVDSVFWVIRREFDGVTVHEAPATIVGDPLLGTVYTPLTSAVTAQAGLYAWEVVCTWGDGQQISFPAEPRVGGPDHGYLRVRSDLMSTVVPVATSGPTNGQGANVLPPLFIPDGGTGTVLADGQHVFAGANATINVDPAVSLFTVAQWNTQTPWAAGTTPTVVQAGTTLDPSVVLRLENAGDDEVTVARESTGSVWYATGPASGSSSDSFVRYGPTLPDPSTYIASSGTATFTKTDDTDGVSIGNYITNGVSWILDRQP